jgi:hypothetical protein
MGKPIRKIDLGIEAFIVLEPCAVKVASTVLRGRWRSNALLLPAQKVIIIYLEVDTSCEKLGQPRSSFFLYCYH